MDILFVTGLTETQEAIFEANKDQLEEIFNEEGLTMLGVIDKDGKLLISGEPMNKKAIIDRIERKIKEEIGIGTEIRL